LPQLRGGKCSLFIFNEFDVSLFFAAAAATTSGAGIV
jgi:hypothetical protein